MLNFMMMGGNVEVILKNPTHEMLVVNQGENAGYGYRRNAYGNFINPEYCPVDSTSTMNIYELFATKSYLYFRGINLETGALITESDIQAHIEYSGGITKLDKITGSWIDIDKFYYYLKKNEDKKIKLRIVME